jgi:hypothetical protein
MSTVTAVEKALQKAGVQFIPAGEKGEGVRLSRPDSSSARFMSAIEVIPDLQRGRRVGPRIARSD